MKNLHLKKTPVTAPAVWASNIHLPPLKAIVAPQMAAMKRALNVSVVLYLYEPEQESGSEAESGASSDNENQLEEQLLNSK